MVEQKNQKPSWFKKVFDDMYEVTLVRPDTGETTVFHMQEVTRKTNKMIKGRDEHGRKFEYCTVEPFDYMIKKLY